MKQVIVHQDAEVELWQAVDYYESKRAGLGLELEKRSARLWNIFIMRQIDGHEKIMIPDAIYLNDFHLQFIILNFQMSSGLLLSRIKKEDLITGEKD